MPPDSGFEGIAHRYLSLARAAIGMDMAWLSEHSATGQVVRAVDGASGLMSLADGSVVPCDCAFRSGHPRARATTIIGDVRSHTFIGHAPAAWRVAGAYASTPVHLADDGCSGHSPA